MCINSLTFFSFTMLKDLREFDHSELLFQEFANNTPFISELSSYMRKPKICYQTANHDLERLLYLTEFPTIKQLYLKYNCIFATEADVERVFSYAGIIFVFFCLSLVNEDNRRKGGYGIYRTQLLGAVCLK